MEQNKSSTGSTDVASVAERVRAATTNLATNVPVMKTGVTGTVAEGEVRQLLEEFADSIRSGKIEDIMSFYDPSLVAFDVAPPLRFTSANDYRKNWETLFTTAMQFPVTYEWSEEKLIASGDVAVFHSIVHTAGKLLHPMENGESQMDCWGRYTCCLKKSNNRWRIIHEHFSVPVAEDGKGLMNLKPGYQTSH